MLKKVRDFSKFYVFTIAILILSPYLDIKKTDCRTDIMSDSPLLNLFRFYGDF